MKNQLQVNNEKEQVIAIDSREVADMLGKKHSELLQEIEGRKDGKNVGIIPTLEKGNFHLSNYFIESSYKAGTRNYKCYLITKLGCELLGNKQQGERGIIFSAKYVERFNQMEKELAFGKFNLPSTYKEALLALVAAEEEKELLIAQNKEQEELLTIQAPKVDLYEDFMSKDNLYSVGDIAKTLAIKDMGKNNLYKYLRLNKIFMDRYEAYQKHVKAGHVIHRNRTYTYGNEDKQKTVTEICGYFTPKGVEYLYKKLKKDGYVTPKSLEKVVEELKPITEIQKEI